MITTPSPPSPPAGLSAEDSCVQAPPPDPVPSTPFCPLEEPFGFVLPPIPFTAAAWSKSPFSLPPFPPAA